MWISNTATAVMMLPIGLSVIALIERQRPSGQTPAAGGNFAAALLFPVMASLAESLGLAPAELLVTVALAASCAFMMPIATPPNAAVYGSDRLTHGQMARAGLLLNLLSVALIPLWIEILSRSGLLELLVG